MMKSKKKSFFFLLVFMLSGCGLTIKPSTTSESFSSFESTDEDSSSLSSLEQSSSSSVISSSSSSQSQSSSSSSSSVPDTDKRKEDYSYSPFFCEKVPNIKINTETGLDFATVPDRLNKWDYVDCQVSVDNCDADLAMDSIDALVKVRGNYTANYEKKPLRIKFRKKQNMLALNDGNKSKSWVLLADYKDSSLLRNATSFYLGKTILGSDGFYSSDYRPVNLYLNQQYWGMYLLCEQQEANENRIEVSEPVEGNTSNDIGYLFEYDGYYTEENEELGGDPTFTIDYCNHQQLKTKDNFYVTPSMDGFTLKSDITAKTQKEFIANYMDLLYDLIYDAVYFKRYSEFDAENKKLVPSSIKSVEELVGKYVDIDSLVDIYLLNEIACNPDIAWSSFYMDIDFSKDSLKKLTFEASWDFDSAFGLKKDNCESGKGYFAANCNNPWLIILINEPFLQEKIKEKWLELCKYGIVKKALNNLDLYSSLYVDDYLKNFQRWPGSIGYCPAIDKEVREETRDFKKQKDAETFFKDWLYLRMNYLNSVFGDSKDVLTGK